MRIVHYLWRLGLDQGGTVRALFDLTAALAARGHDVWVLSFDPLDAPPAWSGGAGGLPRVMALRRLAGRLPRADRASAARAAALIEGADAVHLHDFWDPACLQVARLARRAGVPYVVSVHGMLDDWSMSQKRLKKHLYLVTAGRRLLERAAAVHVTAEAERRQSIKWYPAGRPVMLPYVFDLGPYLQLPGPDEARQAFPAAFRNGGATLLFLSRIDIKKRADLLVEAAALLRGEGAAVRVLVAGRGDESHERGLRELVEARGLSECVSFLGFVSGRTKVSLCQAADVFVLPTSQENWGIALVESLACGTPVITTRGVDIWTELEGSGGALIVEQTAEAIAAGVRTLLSDQERLAAMGRSGREWVLRTLGTDHVAARYEQMYRELREA
jgi:glycosyltransferase involved in cell wall biosynthesis